MSTLSSPMAEKSAVPGLLVQHGIDPPHAAGEIRAVELIRHGRGPPGTVLLHRGRHLLHLCRRGTGADGIGENVHPGKPAPADKLQRLGKLLLRFAGKAHDHAAK